MRIERFAIAQAVHDFGGGLAPWKLPEELLDVLDFERAGSSGYCLIRYSTGLGIISAVQCRKVVRGP